MIDNTFFHHSAAAVRICLISNHRLSNNVQKSVIDPFSHFMNHFHHNFSHFMKKSNFTVFARYLLFLRLFWTAGLRDYRTTGL